MTTSSCEQLKILVLGDSTSFGAELSDLNGKNFSEYGNKYHACTGELEFSKPSALSWPALLSKKLDCSVENQSIIGGSNDRIFRLAIDNTIDKSWNLIICAWTSIDRFDLTDGDQDLALSYRSHWGFDWIKEYLVHHHNPQRDSINFAIKLLALQSYFEKINQSYIFVKSQYIHSTPRADKILNNLDKTYWLSWHNDFYTWTEGEQQGPDGHVLETGHEIIANRIYEFINKQKLL
jgi:hypothetical protein